MKLSVILPVYNTEKYLDKCLKSILENTFKDFELIVLNDGSKDNSEEIILNYKSQFNEKMVYIKKENTGLSDTRNVGISLARGEYIIFIDSDDYVENNMFKLLVEKIDEGSFDMVVCDLNLVYENSKTKKVVSSGYKEDIFHKEKIKETMAYYYPAVWNKIYKTSIVKECKFKPNVWYEDIEFMLRLYPMIERIGVINKPLYNYLQRAGSITYTYNDKLMDIVNNMDEILDYYKKNNLFAEYKNELEYLYVRYLFATFPKRLAKCKDYKKYNDNVQVVLNKVRINFPNYKKNCYLKNVGIKGIYLKHFGKILSKINYIAFKNKKNN